MQQVTKADLAVAVAIVVATILYTHFAGRADRIRQLQEIQRNKIKRNRSNATGDEVNTPSPVPTPRPTLSSAAQRGYILASEIPPTAEECHYLDNALYDPTSPACMRDMMPTIPDHLLPKRLQKAEVEKNGGSRRKELPPVRQVTPNLPPLVELMKAEAPSHSPVETVDPNHRRLSSDDEEINLDAHETVESVVLKSRKSATNQAPSTTPTKMTTKNPTYVPSESPSDVPTVFPNEKDGPTSLPTEYPSLLPSEENSFVPSEQPFGLPSASPSSTPTLSPVESNPTVEPTIEPSVNECPVSVCDFSFLEVGVFVSEMFQHDKLDSECNLQVSGSRQNGDGYLPVNVFDSSNPTAGDWELGSPHSSCGGDSNVDGEGGDVNGDFPNCVSQDNVLVLQEEGIHASVPESSNSGGCMMLDFVDPIDVANLGILNVKPGEHVRLYIENADGEQEWIVSPDAMSENSLWLVNMTHPFQQHRTLKIEICFPSTGAVAFVSYHKDCTATPTISPAPTTLSTLSPTLLPTEGPSELPTEGPTMLPSEYDPSSEPSFVDRRFLGGSSNFIHCDFSSLERGVFLSNVDQSDWLKDTCSMAVTGAGFDGTGTKQVIVGTSKIRTNGTSCNSDAETEKDEDCYNHTQTKTLLIKADDGKDEEGGCINIDFTDPVKLMGVGLVELPAAESIRITIMNDEGLDTVVSSPESAGFDELWVVNQTYPNIQQKGVVLITICSGSSIALSFIDFYAETNKEPSDEDLLPVAHVSADESYPSCGHHMLGFSLVETSGSAPIPGFESFLETQKISLSKLPRKFFIKPLVDSKVGAIRFHLPETETVLYPPFNLKSEWLQNMTGVVHIRADAFSDIGEQLLGSCEIVLNVDASRQPSCSPDFSGFFFMAESGERLCDLRDGQLVLQSELPPTVGVTVNSTSISAIKFEGDFSSVYSINLPFLLSTKGFGSAGKYTVKALGYQETDFSSFVDSCAVTFEVVEKLPHHHSARAKLPQFHYETVAKQDNNDPYGIITDFIEEETGNGNRIVRKLEEEEQFELSGEHQDSPTSSPTEQIQQFLDGAAHHVHCDFSTLSGGVLLSTVEQRDQLEGSCALTVSGVKKDGIGTHPVKVFNTTDITNGMGNLGSPHSSCGGIKKVDGKGGHSDGLFPNCEPQGNVLILDGADSNDGGCIKIDFVAPVLLRGLGILDPPSDALTSATVVDEEGHTTVVMSKENAGPNSLWMVHKTDPALMKQKGVVLITVCFPSSSGAISFVDYTMEAGHFAHAEAIEMNEEQAAEVHEEPDQMTLVESEESIPWCGHHLSQFSLVDSAGEIINGFEKLSNHQIVNVANLPHDVAIAPRVDKDVGSIKYHLPSEEGLVVPQWPFLLDTTFLHQNQGTIKIQADAFAIPRDTLEDQFLGSCDIILEIEQSHQIHCGEGVTGFFLVNRNGSLNKEYQNLSDGQIIHGNQLQYGTDLGVQTDSKTVIKAVKFEVEDLRDLYQVNETPFFRMNSNKFHLPGTYKIKAHGFRDKEFLEQVNTCEITIHIL